MTLAMSTLLSVFKCLITWYGWVRLKIIKSTKPIKFGEWNGDLFYHNT